MGSINYFLWRTRGNYFCSAGDDAESAKSFLAMARDGLLPESVFGAVHNKFRTPWKSTILTGIFVATLAGFLPLRILAELVNIGTLFAFVVSLSAVLIMRKMHPEAVRPFRAPLFPFVPDIQNNYLSDINVSSS